MTSAIEDTKINATERRMLYRISFLSTWAMMAYLLATMILLLSVGGIPESVQEIFSMLQNNVLIGLLRLELLSILFMPLYFVIFYAVYHALKPASPIFTGLAFIFVAVGVILFMATPSTFSWLALSEKYTAAVSSVEKSQIIAAGESILASDMWHGSGARMGGLLMQIGTLGISILMLKNTKFSKATAIIGIGMHGLDLLHIVIGVFTPQLGAILMMIAGPFYLVWFPLLGRDFLRLAKAKDLT
ncbi:MAG: hypothetical protein JEZ00_16760 [Anaerolineaceae bacterium]|nr:hypothetical protein [Anaerolineaceae bacterium]